jgi:threonine dehydratase
MEHTQTPGTTDVDAAGIEAIERLIRPHIRRTPVIETPGADFGLADATLVFKLELLQYAGSFKARGAFANLLGRQVPSAGVVAASGGNHGVAVAYAAHALKLPARIFVPIVASEAKVERIRRYGADLEVIGDRYADALVASERWAAESGALSVHAFDEPHTLLGQGTLGLELEEQVGGIDTLLVAVGGGGLIGGLAAWFQDRIRRGTLRIVGVEPEAAPTLTLALRAGRPVDAPAGGIAADSLAPRRVGGIMFPIARELVSEVLLVSDPWIQEAQQQLWSNLRIAAEPGGAAAFAALVSRKYVPRSGERVGILVCGGNTNAVEFPAVPGPVGQTESAPERELA